MMCYPATLITDGLISIVFLSKDVTYQIHQDDVKPSCDAIIDIFHRVTCQ